MNETAVALIAKVPEPGKAKTRFSPPCTPHEAADFARAFLLDCAAVVTSASVDCDAWCAYLGEPDAMQTLVGNDFRLLEQRGNNLDDRLAHVADDLFAMGYERVVLLGADCPTVDVPYLVSALELLDDNDVVLGPANDGGYVLLAQRVCEPSLYAGIQMSTSSVAEETIERADALDLRYELLHTLHDLDTVDELLDAFSDGQLDHATNTLNVMRNMNLAPTQ